MVDLIQSVATIILGVVLIHLFKSEDTEECNNKIHRLVTDRFKEYYDKTAEYNYVLKGCYVYYTIDGGSVIEHKTSNVYELLECDDMYKTRDEARQVVKEDLVNQLNNIIND